MVGEGVTEKVTTEQRWEESNTTRCVCGKRIFLAEARARAEALRQVCACHGVGGTARSPVWQKWGECGEPEGEQAGHGAGAPMSQNP